MGMGLGVPSQHPARPRRCSDVPAWPLFCFAPQNPCVALTSLSRCTELEGGWALPPSSRQHQGAGPGVQARLWDLSKAWGLRAEAPVGEAGGDHRAARWPREDQWGAAGAVAGGRGQGPCGGAFLTMAESPLGPAALSLSPEAGGPDGGQACRPWAEALGWQPGGSVRTSGRGLAATAGVEAFGIYGVPPSCWQA